MKNKMPLLSIIAPIRNESSYILELINSFYKINDERVELVISDNHSNDGSFELIKDKAAFNIKVVRPDFQLSPFDNHVFALNQSSGKFIFPVGGDDYISPDCIKEILDKLRPGVIVIPRLRSFDNKSGETIKIANKQEDVICFFKTKFSIRRYLKYINYDELIFVVCERKMLNHLNYIKPNTLETFASWSNLFLFHKSSINDIVFLESILLNKRYNKDNLSASFADDQYGSISMLSKSLDSIINTFIYFKDTKDGMQTLSLLFSNRYVIGYYNHKTPKILVRKLITFSPVVMFFISPFLDLKRRFKS
tara:strand:- start:330 stop:1250 length:921 start_codon:yes stop_codon:yes gene_type:complete